VHARGKVSESLVASVPTTAIFRRIHGGQWVILVERRFWPVESASSIELGVHVVYFAVNGPQHPMSQILHTVWLRCTRKSMHDVVLIEKRSSQIALEIET
jgi:hypothetical protein